MNYTSADFKVQYISRYTLYINSDWVKDQLVVVDNDNKVLWAENYDSAHPSQEVTKILSLPFAKVYITLPHERLIWLPTEVFQQSAVDEYRSFFDGSEQIWTKDIESLSVTALYQYDLLLYYRWKRIYPEAHFVPVFDVIMHQVQASIPIRGTVLGAYLYDQQIDLFLFVNGAFHFYNTFEIATIDDMSYFVLQLLKNFQIEGKVSRILVGGVSLDSAWAKRMALYSDDLQAISSKHQWTLHDVDTAEQTDRIHIMADSVLCVS